MGKIIQQIPINVKEGKNLFLVKVGDNKISYRVSTNPKKLEIDNYEIKDDFVILGQFYFHKNFLNSMLNNDE